MDQDLMAMTAQERSRVKRNLVTVLCAFWLGWLTHLLVGIPVHAVFDRTPQPCTVWTFVVEGEIHTALKKPVEIELWGPRVYRYVDAETGFHRELTVPDDALILFREVPCDGHPSE